MIQITLRQCFAVGLVVTGLATLSSCGKKPRSEQTAITADVLPFVVADSVDHGYVGWSVCSECHARRVEEFQETRHFFALRLPDQMEFPPGFRPDANFFVPPGSPVRFEMTAIPKAAITVTPVVPNSGAKTVSPIAYVYGAGAGTDEVYFTRRGEEVFEMPVAWLHRQSCWGAAPFDPYGSGDMSRPLAPQCLECHTVWVDYQRGSPNRYGPFEPQLLGVTCERCHGPAKTHVAHHRAHPAEKIPAHIVQPRTLSRERKMDLCAQCHTNTVRHRRPPFSYRPGEALDESFLVLEMQYPEEDRVANQVRYLKESRCYQKSESLTCTTCHDPHRKSHRGDSVSTSQSCLNCHLPESCGKRSQLPESVRDQCATCHMPRRNKVQVNFETAEGDISFPAPRFEHRIAVYPEAGQELLHDWYGTQTEAEASPRRVQLAKALTDHWTQVADVARSEQRFLVAIDAYRMALRFGESVEIRGRLADVIEQKRKSNAIWFEGEYLKRERRLDEAIATFEKLLTIEPNLPKAHLELGTLFAATARNSEAVEHLQAAIRNDPNDSRAHAMLGWLDYLGGRPHAALEHYRQAAAIEPWSARIEQMQGVCLAQLGRFAEAVQAYQRCLTIDPKHTESAHDLGQILRERFSAKEARPLAVEAVKITLAQQSRLLLALAEIYRDLGQLAEARQTISVARRVAETKEAALLPQIRAVETSLEGTTGRR